MEKINIGNTILYYLKTRKDYTFLYSYNEIYQEDYRKESKWDGPGLYFIDSYESCGSYYCFLNKVPHKTLIWVESVLNELRSKK